MEYDDDHFNFDMVMNVQNYNSLKKDKDDPNSKSDSQKKNESSNKNNKKMKPSLNGLGFSLIRYLLVYVKKNT